MRIVVLVGILLASAEMTAVSHGQETKPKPKPDPVKLDPVKPDPVKPVETKPASRADQLKVLRRAYSGQAEKLQEEIDDLQLKLDELTSKQADLAAEQIARLMELVEADPKDDVALAAIDQLLHELLDHLDKEQATKIFEVLAQHHAASEKVVSICEFTAELELSDAIRAFLAAVIAKNKNAEARAWSHFAIATSKYTEADAANDPKLFAEAEHLFEKVVKEIPAESTEGTPVDVSERYLFELRNLLPGKPAPDFETADLKGKPVKLSQQRGKVTLLVFWATWCDFCAELQPQQAELVKKYSGRPFSIVAVSGDDDADTVAQHLKQHPLPWAHWWNGPEGGVLDAWNVQHFPTVYLIDAAGVIRYRNIQGAELSKAVELLVKEAEEKKKDQ